MAKRKTPEVEEVEKDKVFKMDFNLNTGVGIVDSYMKDEAKHQLIFNITQLKRLIESLCEHSVTVKSNMYKIVSGDSRDVPYLPEEKTEESFKKLIDIVQKAETVYSLCVESFETIMELEAYIEESKKKQDIIEVPETGSVFEAIQRKIRKERKEI